MRSSGVAPPNRARPRSRARFFVSLSPRHPERSITRTRTRTSTIEEARPNGSGGASPYQSRDEPHASRRDQKKSSRLPGSSKLTLTLALTYFFGSHFAQFAANSSTLSFVTGISSPLTKVEAGFLLSATMSYSISTDLVPHS